MHVYSKYKVFIVRGTGDSKYPREACSWTPLKQVVLPPPQLVHPKITSGEREVFWGYLVHPEAILAPSNMAAPPRKPSVGLTPVVVPHVPER